MGDLKLIDDFLGKEFIDADWDSLMEVVEKIEAIFDPHHGFFGVHINSNGCTIQGTFLRTNIKQNPPVYFDTITHGTKYMSTLLAVTNFIVWFNEKLK